MKSRDELEVFIRVLRTRRACGEELEASKEALALRGSGLSVVETGVILAEGLGMRLADVQELLIMLAVSGEDVFE